MRLLSLNNVALGTGVALHHLAGRRVPLSATVAITNKCNLRCRYCGCHLRRMPEMSTAQAEQLLDSLWRLGTRKVGFTGGEPLVRKDIFDLVDHAKRLGFITHLVTNATRLTKHNVTRLGGLDLLCISYEGPPEVHGHLRPGVGRRTLDKITLAKDHGINVCAMTTLVRQNIPHLQFIMDRSREGKFPVMFSLLHHHECAAEDLTDLEPGAHDLARAAEALVRFKRKGYPVANSYSYLTTIGGRGGRGTPACYAGKLYVVVDANGDVYPCWPAMGKMKPLNAFTDGVERAISGAASPACDGCTFPCHQELNFLLSLRPDALMNAIRGFHGLWT